MLQVYNIDFYPQLELILILILWSVTNARYQLKRLVNYTSLRIGEKRTLSVITQTLPHGYSIPKA